MKDLSKEVSFVEKYRPQTIKDVILPERIKKQFESFINKGEFPNLLLTGGAGTGKTTIARALCNDLGLDYKLINASSERNIDTVRTTIRNFASTVSLEGSQKCIILDESDGLAPVAQAALRAAIEEFSNTRFILTANYKNKLIDPLHSRLATVEFNVNKSEKAEMLSLLFKRVREILELENIEYDKDVLKQFLVKLYPDVRKIINNIQRFGASGSLDSSLLASINNASVDRIVKYLKDKDFSEIKKWVAENEDIDTAVLYQELYETLYNELDQESIPQLVLYLADYQFKDSFVANKEINTLALLVEIMANLSFK